MEPFSALEPAGENGGEATGYHRAAAVLSHFNPDLLKPVGGTASESDFQRLLADSTVLKSEKGPPVWSLRLDVRQHVLQSMTSPQAMLDALQANPDRPTDEIQRVFETYLRGETIPLDTQSPEQIKATARVVEWIGDLLPNVPRPEALQARFDRDQLLAPFRALADRHFKGRTTELDDLRDYVGVLPPRGLARAVTRVVQRARGWQDRAIMIHGIGGVGKSALVGQFLLEHADAGPEFHFPFVYLDFDRPELSPEEPVTLVAEAARQLAAQHPEVRADALKLREELLSELHAVRRQRRRSGSSSPNLPQSDPALNPSSYADRIYAILQRVTGGNKPLVIVLDTFEQVQHRGPAVVALLWEFLGRMRSRMRRLRLVVSGRAPLDQPDVVPIPIGPLDENSAVEHLRSVGILDADLAERIFDKVGGHPLCLRLAARLVLDDANARGLDELKTRDWLFFRVDAEVIQGLLYKRLLNHLGLKDPKLQKLAHPGLLLRRVTPDLIFEVLARPCGLKFENREEARQLFGQLGRHVWVVEQQPDGSLRHRPDLRTIMLPLLVADRGYPAREIHLAAVEYYEKRPSLGERAEEIYHRLMLDQELAKVQPRWIDGVEKQLWQSYEELSAPAKVMLAKLSGESVDPKVKEKADQQAWEGIAYREASNAVTLGKFPEALATLRERSGRVPGSRLFGLEAELLVLTGHFDAAIAVLAAGIDSAYRAGLSAGADVLGLVLRKAQFELRRHGRGYLPGVDNPAARFVDEFRALASRYSSDVRLLQLGALRLAPLQEQRALGKRGDVEALPQLESDVMNLWERQPRALPEGEDFALVFQLVGALFPAYPDRVMARIRDAFLGSELASAAISEQGASGRTCRDLLAQLARAVDATLPSRTSEESVRLWLSEAEGTQAYGSEAYTYGRLLDELLNRLHSLPERQVSAFLRLVRQASLPAAARPTLSRQIASVHVLVRSMGQASSPPPAAVLLPGTRPFVGRASLRKFLQSIAHKGAPRILVVCGPPGSGKTYSLQLIRHVAQATEGFDVAAVGLRDAPDVTARDLTEMIAREAGWRTGSLPPKKKGQAKREVRALVAWLAGQVADRAKPLLLVLDDLDNKLPGEIEELVVQLAIQAAGAGSEALRLALLGLDPALLPAPVRPSVIVEHLGPIAKADLAEFFAALRPASGMDAAEVGLIVSTLHQRIAASPRSAHLRLNEALSDLVEFRLGDKSAG